MDIDDWTVGMLAKNQYFHLFPFLTSEIISLARVYVESSFNVEFCSLEYVFDMNYLCV